MISFDSKITHFLHKSTKKLAPVTSVIKQKNFYLELGTWKKFGVENELGVENCYKLWDISY